MNKSPIKEEVVEAIRRVANEMGKTPSRSQFIAQSGISEYWVLTHFNNWTEAVHAAGLVAYSTNIKLADDDLLMDWGELVRKHRQIPTRDRYRREGKYSPGVFEKHFGPWSTVPGFFDKFATGKPEWTDVLALLPQPQRRFASCSEAEPLAFEATVKLDGDDTPPVIVHGKRDDRPTYGNPIDFRGLRHEPVNEQGVVFLFGMVARELGYMVEAVRTNFPDCKAKRQVGRGKWEDVHIEFEYESRNFRDHGHRAEGCDVIVCWRHNWSECPKTIEVVELADVIGLLSKSDD